MESTSTTVLRLLMLCMMELFKVLSSRILNSVVMCTQKFSGAFILMVITNEPQELAV
jgi:hypothetical protein